jgi:O-acetyl-ADP-ribose deacetylase (regulator of RNase III)
MAKKIKGDLIKLALQGKFDVIVHGCNCFNTMGAGIAVQMANVFGCDKFNMEYKNYKGDINKLGQIDHRNFNIVLGKVLTPYSFDEINLTVINAYTQFETGRNLDYVALKLCLKKINYLFKGKHIGLPLIGCGIAGGNWEIVQRMIQITLKDCKVTIVEYEKN